MDGCVYKVTNKINNIIYVGETIQPIEMRWTKHLRDASYGSTCPFHKALREYGKDNFTWEVIEEFTDTTQEFLWEREKYWIRYYDSYYNGYNGTIGGCEPPSTEKPVICLETDTIYHSAKEASEQTGISSVHIAECARCEENRTTAGGYHWMRLEDFLKYGKVYRKTKNELNSKPVICLETNTVYPSILKASRETGVSRNSIEKCCEGKLKRNIKSTKFHWKYYISE